MKAVFLRVFFSIALAISAAGLGSCSQTLSSDIASQPPPVVAQTPVPAEVPAAVAVPSEPPPAWRDAALATVGFFETSRSDGWDYVAADFDCQGLSAGLLQWNIGRGSLSDEILSRIDREAIARSMPTYGARFLDAMDEGRPELLSFVQGLQSYRNAESCDGAARGARWTEQGEAFSAEVSALIGSDEGLAAQRAAMADKLELAWSDAVAWSAAKRTPDTGPTYVEFAYFLDARNFSGGWWVDLANYQQVQSLRARTDGGAVFQLVMDYLRADLGSQYQNAAALENADLWDQPTVTEDQADLMAHAYLISSNIGTANGVPFKKLVVSRRGAIIFNDGWVNSTRVRFPQPD